MPTPSAGIGPAGGTVSLPSGASIVIPPGALAQETVITIEAIDVPQATLGAVPIGLGLAAGPEGLTFAKPVEVRLPFDPARVPAGTASEAIAIRMAPHASNAFVSLASTIDMAAKFVTTQTTHFTDFVPAAPPPGAGPPLVITTQSLANAVVGVPYNATLAATGGTPPLTWALSAGSSLPAGLTLAADGAIGGTATSPATAAFFVAVTDSAGKAVQAALGLTVTPYTSPLPVITGMSPSSALPGAAPVTMTLVGTGFLPTSHVFYDANELAATYVNGTKELVSTVPTALLTPGGHVVKVVNDAPGGGTSAPKTFTVSKANSVPIVTSVSPSSLPANGIATQITVAGSFFVNGSSVALGSQGIATAYVSANKLTATVPASYLTQDGTISVFVFSPAPGGGFSATSVTVNVGTPTASPTLETLSMTDATTGDAGFTLDVTGTGFAAGGEVAFGATRMATVVTSDSTASATIPAAELLAAREIEVRFVNPSPSGASNGLRFLVKPPPIPWASLTRQCGLTTANQVYCWTINADLGTAALFPELVGGGKTFDSIGATLNHVCGIVGGALFCWGQDNTNGQVGTNAAVPTPILPAQSFTSVSASSTQTCAVTSTNKAYCWGKQYGAPGDAANAIAGNYQAVASAQDFVALLTTTGTIGCSGTGGSACVGHSGTYKKVVVDARMTCGISTAGPTYCTNDGLGTCYLGNGALQTPQGTRVQVGLPAGVTFTDLSVSCNFSCGVTTVGDVYCWGSNSNGSLGNGTTTGSATTPVKVPGLPPIASIASSGSSFCALSMTGKRICWGGNGGAVLGLGYKGGTVPTPTEGP